jgi:hypothetical protein
VQAFVALVAGLALTALPFGRIYKNGNMLKIFNIVECERKVLHARLKPKNTRVACRDTPDMNEARGLKKRVKLRGCPGEALL